MKVDDQTVELVAPPPVRDTPKEKSPWRPSQSQVRLGETIRALRKAKGLKLSELAAMADTDAGNLSRLERAQQGYSPKTVENVALALGTDMAGLFRHAGIMEFVEEPHVRYAMIPSFVSKRGARGRVKDEPTPIRHDLLEARGLKPDTLRTVLVPDRGMEDRYGLGDLALIDVAQRTIVDGKVFAVEHNGKMKIRRLFGRYDKAVRIVCDNQRPEFAEEVIPASALKSIDIVGRVVGNLGFDP